MDSPSLLPLIQRCFAAKQNAGVESFVAAEEAEAGMAGMSRVFRETGSELYMGAGGREHEYYWDAERWHPACLWKH